MTRLPVCSAGARSRVPQEAQSKVISMRFFATPSSHAREQHQLPSAFAVQSAGCIQPRQRGNGKGSFCKESCWNLRFFHLLKRRVGTWLKAAKSCTTIYDARTRRDEFGFQSGLSCRVAAEGLIASGFRFALSFRPVRSKMPTRSTQMKPRL